MNGRGGSISALVWILVEETSGALETQNPAEPGQVARAGTNRNAPKHYAGSPQTSSHQSIPEVCVEVRDSLLGMTVQGDHFYHSFRRMQGSAVCGERFLILRGPRRRATQGGAGGSPSQDHWISHCALSPAGCCALRVGVCVCVLRGRCWLHTAALDEAGLYLQRMHRTRTAVPLPLNNCTGDWGALRLTRPPSIWTELPAGAAASAPVHHCPERKWSPRKAAR